VEEEIVNIARPTSLLVAVVFFRLAWPSKTTAQQPPRFYRVDNRWSIGCAIGASANGDYNSGHGSLDVSATVEAPVAPEWSVRVDAGRAGWTFDRASGKPAPPERVGLRRLTFGGVRVAQPTHPIRMYAGGGVGMYDYDLQAAPQRLRRFGLYGATGIDVERNPHLVLGTELQVHWIEGPHVAPVNSYALWVAGLMATVRARF
jgi:hypothetical protein